jgi:DNA helicase HerA-like ATPase
MALDALTVARTADGRELGLLPALANRHGLIAGATGTGKTVTLQVIAEHFSRIGVPVFLADVKGDLAGIAAPGTLSAKLDARLKQLNFAAPAFAASPTEFWDVFGTSGHPVRATISDMGPLILSRLLALNDTQRGVLTLAFKIADDAGLLLLDVKDLRSMLTFVGENAKHFTTEYGNISAASIGAIQRGLLELDQQGASNFFGEPMLDIDDLIQTANGPSTRPALSTGSGQGVINILAADQLMNSRKLYATFLLWMQSEIFEHLPEVGDPEKPVMVFFFDEAHLLFADAPPALVEKIEQVVRLIRSKGVGVYFVTQNPLDIPETILGQLGNRVQHALRAFTPRDQKAVKAAASTLRANPKLDTEAAITELAVGEGLVSFLDEKGSPAIVERAWIVPPGSRIGPLTAGERAAVINGSVLKGRYETAVDQESAYEKLKARAGARGASESKPMPSVLKDLMFGTTGPRGGHHDGLLQSAARSAARSVGSGLGRSILRGMLGSILGK